MIAACAGRQDGESRDFTNGRKAVIKGDYHKAVSLLQNYLDKSPRGKHASRSHLFLGKAYVGLRDYERAKEIYRNLADSFPNTLEGYKAQYKIAEIEMYLGRKSEARALFAKLANGKNGPFTPEAEMFEIYLKSD